MSKCHVRLLCCAQIRNLEILIAPIVPSNAQKGRLAIKSTVLVRLMSKDREMKVVLRRRRKKARYWSKASPNNHPGHDFHFMYPKRELGRKYRPFVATYRRYVSKMRWFWQDLRAVHPKSPANHCLRIHRVQILPGRAPFPVRGAQIMHSAHFLPFPRQTARMPVLDRSNRKVQPGI